MTLTLAMHTRHVPKSMKTPNAAQVPELPMHHVLQGLILVQGHP